MNQRVALRSTKNAKLGFRPLGISEIQMSPPSWSSKTSVKCFYLHSSLNIVQGVQSWNKRALQYGVRTFSHLSSTKPPFSTQHDKVKQTADPGQRCLGFCGVLMGWQLQRSLKVKWKTNKYREIHFYNLDVFKEKSCASWTSLTSDAHLKERKAPIVPWRVLIQVWNGLSPEQHTMTLLATLSQENTPS